MELRDAEIKKVLLAQDALECFRRRSNLKKRNEENKREEKDKKKRRER